MNANENAQVSAQPEFKIPYLDVLAARYVTPEMIKIWSEYNIIIQRRRLWVATLKAQMALGMTNITARAIADYEAVINEVDLDSIKNRERRTRHDVKAQIEEFNAQAGHELLHEGYTSRDITDNTEQMMIRDSLNHVHGRVVAILNNLGVKAATDDALDICGRSHLIVGQTTTVGKRFANLAQEMLIAYNRLRHLMDNYQLRGIKGAMGTQQDILALLGNDPGKVAEFEKIICQHLGFSKTLISVGQVYPRSLDFEVVSVLFQLAGAAGNFAKMVRLMSGLGLGHEGFKEGRTGSTGMPHKMNSSTSERINGLVHVLRGYYCMIESLVGDQWFEGDVSCSVVRRVALSGAFFAFDAICESMLTVLHDMELYPEMVNVELRQYLPFLSSTTFLTQMVQAGMGRETAHAMIKKRAIAGVSAMRHGQPNCFPYNLLEEAGFPLNKEAVDEIISKPNHGLAEQQVNSICGEIDQIVSKYPAEASYKPYPLL